MQHKEDNRDPSHSFKPMMTKTKEEGNLFLAIKRIDELAAILGIQSIILKTQALNPEYHTFKIPKKSGGYRKIEAPSPMLKKIQKRLNYHLQHVYLLFRPDFVHGFIIRTEPGTPPAGIISNASAHVSASNILTLDLEDFFHSFKAKQIWDLFSGFPFNFPVPVANILTMLTTWYDILPMGSPTSPVLSNFLMLDLDKTLASYALKNYSTYTRYVDDMTFSFNRWISDEIIQGIRQNIEQEGLRWNNKKFRVQSANAQQTVTGLVVNRKVNINRKYIRKIRAVLFDWCVNGLSNATMRYYKLSNYPDKAIKYRFLQSVNGRIQFVGYVRGKNDRIYKNLNNQYNYLLVPWE